MLMGMTIATRMTKITITITSMSRVTPITTVPMATITITRRKRGRAVHLRSQSG
jgi:hypothetical protein